jgi:hypothetical protein
MTDENIQIENVDETKCQETDDDDLMGTIGRNTFIGSRCIGWSRPPPSFGVSMPMLVGVSVVRGRHGMVEIESVALALESRS